MTQSRMVRRCIGVRLPPSMVNISISPSGVTTGARPPETPSGKMFSRSSSRWSTWVRAQ